MVILTEKEFNNLVDGIDAKEVKGLGKGISNSGKFYGNNKVVYKQWILPNGDIAECGMAHRFHPFFHVFSKQEIQELNEMPRNIAKEVGTISSKSNPIF